MNTIEDFLDSDVQTLTSRDTCLRYAKNVQSGHHAELELTGNAFNVRFLPSGVCIESLWDEDAEPIEMDLEEFIRIVSGWIPNQ